ncbi:MAG: aromatic ring-hydroxylating dioxygenase subunit alpha [Sulfitobacter sp.]|nr:aromatic ring-hydroxylating dioxygenase subunit alpha [Sulfitobacter sp.]
MDLDSLLATQRPGHAMPQAFYRSDAVWEADKEAVFGREWMLAGHISELPRSGDYLLFDILDESVIVCRDGDRVRAFANVCRHRGSRLCREPSGNLRRFTCPYHAWAYGLDGSLVRARLLEKGHDDLSLHAVAVEVLEGLIYVSLADDPPDFATLRATLTPLLTPFGLARTRIAHREQYPVQANWKLLIENYNECYHCSAAHPEFSRSHAIHLPDARVEPLNAAMAAKSAACGAPTALVEEIGTGGVDHAYNRYALFDGFATGSEDGQPLAPRLGGLTGFDGGASDAYVGILNPMLIYCDHAVLYRFLPQDRDTCIQEIIWLVQEDAVEGRDYDRDRLTWLWDVTTRADKRIVEDNAAGIAGRHYRPGPLTIMERYVERFIIGYQAKLKEHQP